MFLSFLSLLVVIVLSDVCLVVGWNPANFSFNPGNNYHLVFEDEFENVGPVKAIINGQPAYAPNPKNWAYAYNTKSTVGMQNYTDSINNSYVQNNQLTIAALQKPCTSARLISQNLREFTFGIFAAKIRLPYGHGMFPAWWLLGNGDQYKLQWPTVGEIDVLEMMGRNRSARDPHTDQYARANIHWNSKSNTMNPIKNTWVGNLWQTPDQSILHNNSLVYWTEWTPTNITVGVNEFPYLHFNTTNIPDSINPVLAFNGTWPFYMILDIAVGLPYAVLPDNTTVWPQHMVIDWVRVYQQKKTILDQ